MSLRHKILFFFFFEEEDTPYKILDYTVFNFDIQVLILQ